MVLIACLHCIAEGGVELTGTPVGSLSHHVVRPRLSKLAVRCASGETGEPFHYMPSCATSVSEEAHPPKTVSLAAKMVGLPYKLVLPAAASIYSTASISSTSQNTITSTITSSTHHGLLRIHHAHADLVRPQDKALCKLLSLRSQRPRAPMLRSLGNQAGMGSR
jgi:hypothetical protein